MIDILGPKTRLCDGIGRRDFLKIGALGALGLSLPELMRAEASVPAERRQTEKACILLWLQGGPSQIDTFDPKPDAPAGIRGPFQPIETNVSGIQISEVFPRLARHADKYALLRSVWHPTPAHIVGHQYMLCGMGSNVIAYPNMAAVISKLRGAESLLPPWALVPNLAYETNASPERLCQNAGYLGREYDAIIPQGSLVEGRLTLHELDPPPGISAKRFARRKRLLEVSRTKELAQVSAGRGADAIYRKAFALMDSSGVRQAFDLTKESPKLRTRYGRNHVGQGALLARRMVEAGTRFVTVNWPNRLAWDSHTDLAGQMRTHLAPTLDRALSTLLEDLHQRGMLENTLVIVMGEMGRTPKLGNSDARYADGRDHWSAVMSVLIAGGGVQGGQVVGKSDSIGGYVADRPIPSHDVVASVYHAFGIKPTDRVEDVGGTPRNVLLKGEPIHELF